MQDVLRMTVKERKWFVARLDRQLQMEQAAIKNVK
jgi:hypothetical protein